MAQSIEPNIADLANGWLKKYKLDYKLEQEKLNAEIDKALNHYPILIEYKGYQDRLVKLDSKGQVDNRSKNGPNFKNINSYAVNGAVHYANALLHHTSYTVLPSA